MTTWEHTFSIRQHHDLDGMQEHLTAMGADGWELVSHTAPGEYDGRWTFTFKRPMEST